MLSRTQAHSSPTALQSLHIARSPRALTLLCAAKQRAVLLERKVDLDEVGAGEELHDHAARDDGRDAELHERAAVRRQNDAHPVERVRRVARHDAVQRNLRRDEEDGKHDGRPGHARLERHCRGGSVCGAQGLASAGDACDGVLGSGRSLGPRRAAAAAARPRAHVAAAASVPAQACIAIVCHGRSAWQCGRLGGHRRRPCFRCPLPHLLCQRIHAALGLRPAPVAV